MCCSLESVTIQNGVREIGSSAFSFCESLTSVTIPNSIVKIGDYAFYGCSFTNVYVPECCLTTGFEAFPLFCLPKKTNEIIYYYGFKEKKDKEVAISEDFTNIGTSAFSDCSALANVVIPNSIIMIKANSFWNCTSITGINIPNSVVYIGKSAKIYSFHSFSLLSMNNFIT